jgi:ABC-2 type transport system ATP-binding protein
VAEAAIETRGLRKSYGELEAVRGVDLSVAAGEVFALLGPNGAGKTTIVEILEGHRDRSAGEVRVLGYDPGARSTELRQRIGIVLQETGVEPYFSVEETIELFRGYYPHPRPADEVIELVGLQEQRKTRVMRLSGGQQRRLDVAIGLAGDPDLLFLDEPTTGFDPMARRGAWEMIRGLQALGKTIFLTTHYMEEAEYLADRVAIIKGGEIIAEGRPRELVAGEPGTIVRFRLPADLPDLAKGLGAVVQGGLAEIETAAPTALLHQLTSRAQEHGVELQDLSVSRPSLEDMYLKLVGANPEPDIVPPQSRRSRRRRG